MPYRIIQPPFTLKFPEMSRKELKDYFQWFMGQIPERIDELANAVRQTPGYEAWQPDKTPASLDMLGEWFAGQVETRQRTAEEIQEIRSRSVYPIDIPSEELTNRTFSLAVDTGMYLSQVFSRNYPSLRWDQPSGNKKYVDYGQPVLADFGPAGPFNPTHIIVTLAYGLVDKTYSGRRLREIYDIWAKKVHPVA
jgi:hypothetical protein